MRSLFPRIQDMYQPTAVKQILYNGEFCLPVMTKLVGEEVWTQNYKNTTKVAMVEQTTYTNMLFIFVEYWQHLYT